MVRTLILSALFFPAVVIAATGAGSSGGGDDLSSAASQTPAATDCPSPTTNRPPKRSGGDGGVQKKTVEQPSVTQTVYCMPAPTAAKSDEKGLTSGGKTPDNDPAKEKHSGGNAGGGEIKSDTGGGFFGEDNTASAGNSTIKIGFKDLRIEAASPSAWMVIVLLVVAVAAIVIFIRVFPKEARTIGTVALLVVAGVGGAAGAFIGWRIGAGACKDAVEVSVRQLDASVIQAEFVTGVTRTLTDENAQLRKELGAANTRLEIAAHQTPPSVWILSLASGMFGLSIGMLPFGLSGLRRTTAGVGDGVSPERDLYELHAILRDREQGLVREVIDELNRRRRQE